MTAKARTQSVMSVIGASAGTSDEYHVLVLDAGYKQSLACARSLGRTGLRVAMGESFVEFDPALPIPAFRSRYSAYNAVMPNYATDAAGYAAAVVDFVRKHATRVVLPTGDGSIAVLTPVREQLAELGCVLALAPDAALEIANDKDRTLEIARSLGIEQPKTVRFDKLEELPAVLAEFEFPFVLKPTSSWSAQSGNRFVPTEVIDEAEAETVSEMYLGAGFGVLAQQWACGRREGVTLFIVDGEVLASCAHVAHRTAPPLGGASVMRESIPLPADTYAAAVSLATAIGMQGVCEVEFRRDADFRPLLMEINARLAGTIENAVRSGVDFPLMIWQWASGLPVDRSTSYRTGVRTRWLHGDLRWLRENHGRAGRPDSVSRKRALWTFGSEFARTRYCDGFNWRDPGPGLAELRITAATVRKSLNAKLPRRTRVRKGMFTCGIVRCSSSVPVPTACQFLRICAGWG